ncbi:MAG: hydrogenase formation protein HypD [Planctomycetes bacterium]|nr:hydrogenase formation protein HypD [Planctomycetota bacterium]
MLERINRAYGFMDKACRKLGRGVNIMEVSGRHTVSVFRGGIQSEFPSGLKLLAGPGCPICVTGQGYFDSVIALAADSDCIVAVRGDMITLPGKDGSLQSRGATENVKIVSGCREAMDLAKENPSKMVVFAAVGFEAAAVSTAAAIKEAAEQKIENFCIFCAHKLLVSAMKAVLNVRNDRIDAFLCPGNISMIIGSEAYKPIVEQFSLPCVIAGFEPMQIIEALGEICRQIIEDKAEILSIYQDEINPAGDETSRQIISDCFDVTEGMWRGIGDVPEGSLKLRGQYSQFDAAVRLGLQEGEPGSSRNCRCGQVLCGLISPSQCTLFACECTPDTPAGPGMVSSDGTCAAWYKYGRGRKNRGS